MSIPLVLYEPLEQSTALEQLSIGEGLLEIRSSRWPHVKVPILNHTKHEITIPKRTQVGPMQQTGKVLEMGVSETQKVDPPQTVKVRVEVHNVTSPTNSPTEW